MINLLPSHQVERLKDQGRLKLISILGILVLSFCLSLYLAFLFVKGLTIEDIEEQKIMVEEERKIISLNRDLEKEIASSNNLFSDLASFYEQEISKTEVFEKINNTLPTGAYIIRASISSASTKAQTEGKVHKIALTGYCPTREILRSFQEKLVNEDSFSNVYFSPISWVKPIDPIFSVTFNLK